MSNGNKSHTMVTQVRIVDGNSLEVSIGADAFMPGQVIEISGYVAQNNGSFATINDFKKIDTMLGEIAKLTVKAMRSDESAPFEQGLDFMVFLRAAKVWVTVLGEGQAQQPEIEYNLATPGAVWGTTKGVAGAEKYPDTQEGNQQASNIEGVGPKA